MTEQARLQRTTLRVLVASNVLGGVGVASGLAVGALLVESTSGSTSLAGLAPTAMTIGAAALAVPLARLAETSGRRTSLSTGYLFAIAGAVLTIVAALAGSTVLVLVASVLFGGGTAANLQSRYAATDAAQPAQLARALAIVVWATTVGVVLGPNLSGPGGSLGTSIGIPALAGPYLFSAVGFALTLVVIWFGLARLQQAHRAARRPVRRQPLVATFRQVLRIPPARLGLVSVAVAHAVMVGVMSMTSVHLSHHGASLTVVGIVISAHVAGMYALSPVMGWLADRLGRRATIGIGLGILAASMILAAAAPDHAHGMTATALVLLGVGWSACLVAGSALLSGSVPAEIRTSAQGMSDLTMGVLAAAAGTASGPILDYRGFHWLAVFCGLLLVPVAVLAVATRVPRPDLSEVGRP